MNQTMILNKLDTTTMLIAIKITDAIPNRKPPRRYGAAFEH